MKNNIAFNATGRSGFLEIRLQKTK